MAVNQLARFNLNQYQTQIIFPKDSRGPGVYKREMMVEGNSLLSSVFVESGDPGATVEVKYFDYTTGTITVERYDLEDAHPPLLGTDGPLTDRRLVSKIHNKPVVEVTVAGGNVTFGVLVTVVLSFATDLDAALQSDGGIANLGSDKGLPIVCYNEDTGLWEMLRCPFPVTLDEAGDPFRRKDIRTVDLNLALDLIDETVPVGKTWKLAKLRISCRAHANYVLTVDGDIISSGRTGPGYPVDQQEFIPREEVSAGANVKVEFCKIAGPESSVETFLTGFEE